MELTSLFRQAKRVAVNGSRIRRHQLGAVGVRQDGVIVKSANLSNRLPEPQAHAEARVVKKLGWGGTIYVVRILRSGEYALARPCKTCQSIMKMHGVKRCYYSIDSNSYGVIVFD
jgi:tRNA(Arg) A34 adenosine deaminase TadA